MLGVGRANLRMLLCTNALRGAITLFGLRNRRHRFDQHRIINLIGECRFNGVQIRAMAVAWLAAHDWQAYFPDHA